RTVRRVESAVGDAMIVSVAMLAFLAAAAWLVGAAARGLGRPLPPAAVFVFLLVSVSPFPRAWTNGLSVLPLDHARNIVPWMETYRPPANPYLNDVVTQILPWAKQVRLAWKAGEVPFFNRWNGCGMPLMANGLSGPFSPLTFVAFLFPLARSYTLISSLKLLLAAAGMALWVREIGASTRTAVFAGVIFPLSFSFAPPFLIFPQSGVFSLWPWTLFLLERARDRDRRARVVAALTAVFVVTVLLGHAETAVVGFAFMGLWLAARALVGDLLEWRRVFSALAAAAAIAVGLTAFLLIPSVFAIAGSGRLADAERPYWEPLLSTAPHAPLVRELPTSLFPHAVGNGMASPALPFIGGAFPEITLGYFGLVGWIAVFLFLRPGSPRGRTEWVLAGLLVLGWGVGVGAWPFAEIYSHTPWIRYVFPLRLHSWEALAGPALAALELDRLARDAGRNPRALRVRLGAMISPAVVAALGAAVFLAFRAEHAIAGASAFQERRFLIALAVLLASAVLLAALATPAAGGRLPLAGLTVLAAAELLFQWRGLFRLSSPADLFPETPLVAFLRSQPGPFRVVGAGPVMFPGSNVFAGVEDIRTHDAVERHDYLTFLDLTCGYKYEYFKKIRNVDAPALDFLNVRYVLRLAGADAPGPRWRLAYDGADGRVFENGNVLPRAFVPERVSFVAPPPPGRLPPADANALFGGSFREIFRNADWKKTAWILDGGSAGGSGGAAETGDFRERTNSLEFTANVTSERAWIVLSLVQDGGWTARDETGKPLALRRANGPFMALRLPAGTHRVRLRYVPPGLPAGVAISAATAAVLLALALVRLRRRG
ncbi:MAG TPA: YfhO family protein, partial [Thermoanaerobaculia bacterium]